jgi:hypothetical protein
VGRRAGLNPQRESRRFESAHLHPNVQFNRGVARLVSALKSFRARSMRVGAVTNRAFGHGDTKRPLRRAA